MKSILIVVIAAASVGLVAQEREVPKDSMRITVPGCARGRVFVVGPRAEHEPGRSDVPPGKRFRLQGPREVLDEIRKREGSMVQLTGLVRKSDMTAPGVNLGGGVRVSPGATAPGAGSPGRNSTFEETIFDVESWQPRPESCPSR